MSWNTEELPDMLRKKPPRVLPAGAASGCVTHFLIAVAAAILLGSGAHYWGFSGRTVFVVVLIAIFLASVLIPWEKEKKP
jgi:hypothetical protein